MEDVGVPFFNFFFSGGESIVSKPSQKAAAAGPGWKGDRCSGEWAGAQQTAQWGSAGERDSPSVSEHPNSVSYEAPLLLDAEYLKDIALSLLAHVMGYQKTCLCHTELRSVTLLVVGYDTLAHTKKWDYGGNRC